MAFFIHWALFLLIPIAGIVALVSLINMDKHI